MVIRHSRGISGKEAAVILGTGKSSFDETGVFTDEESAFIKKEFKAKNDMVVFQGPDRLMIACQIPAEKTVYVRNEKLRRCGHKILSLLNERKLAKVQLAGSDADPSAILAFAEGMALGNYRFLKYKTEQEKDQTYLAEINIHHQHLAPADVTNLQNLIDAVFLSRTLVNEPLSYLTAVQLSKEIQKIGKQGGFTVQVFDKKKIEDLKMGGILAVNRGSNDPPTFNILEYKPEKPVNKRPFVLVGKGVVYDTGGLSLKPTLNSMDYMKSDMAGAAAVTGVLYAIAKSEVPVHIIGLIPATDNRPGENAYVPGDVITQHNGLTVEVLNTDAEGRLILADALSYAQQYDPELVVDLATLTGAAAAAIGPQGIVCMGTADEKTKALLKASGNETHERLAEFPFWEEYADLLKSDIADMKNIGGPLAGAITAGKFLERFTNYPWIHFDIAGCAFLHQADSYRGRNATGVGVRLLYHFFKTIAS